MKKFILLGFLSLFVLTLHAKEMTVRVVDTFGDPIVGITGYITESNSSWNIDQASFTTDSNGEFTVERTNMNFMNMYIDDYYDWNLPAFYEVVWNGSDNPVIVKMEGFCRFIFKLSGVNALDYDKISIKVNNKNLPIEWNDNGIDTAWIAVDTITQELKWSLSGKILFAPQNQVYNISNPKNREIVIDNPLSEMQKISVGIIGKDGTGITGNIHINKSQAVGIYENILISQTSSDGLYQYYIPKDEYTVSLTDCPSKYILPITSKTISVGEEEIETIFDYTKSYQVVITVYDIEGNPIPEATLYMIDASQSIKTDDQGRSTLFAMPGKYAYEVRVWEPFFMNYKDLLLDVVDADIEKSIHFSDVFTTLYVDVKLRPDMQRNLLDVRLNGNSMSYDNITNLYSIISEKKNVQCSFHYPGTFSKYINIDTVTETPVTFSYEEYRKITISPEDASKYRLDNIRVEMEGSSSTIYATTEPIFLIDNNYVATVDVYDKIAQINYNNETFEFTVDGEDKDVLYTFDDSKFRNVTFKLIAHDGAPMQGRQIYIQPESNGNYFYSNPTDENGITTVKLPQGKYYYSLSNSSPYPSNREEFIIEEEDIEITLSYEGYKKVKVCATGDLLPDINTIIINLVNLEINLDSYLSLYDRNNYTDSCYVPVGEYTYSCGDGGATESTFIMESSVLSVKDDVSIDLNLSSDIFKKVIFDIVDENGLPLYNPNNYFDYEFKIETENGYTYLSSNYTLSEYFYLKKGKYKAGIIKRGDADWQITPFEIENNSSIKIIYKTPKEFTLSFNIEGALPETILNVYIGSNSPFGYGKSIVLTADNNGKAQGDITLQEGDNYIYNISPYNIENELSIHNDSSINVDVSTLHESYIYFKNENGEFIYLTNDYSYYTIYHNNTHFDTTYGYNYYRRYLQEGETYQIYASFWGYCPIIKEITIGSEDNQIFDIILSKSTSNSYTLCMYPKTDIIISAGTLTLDGTLTALIAEEGNVTVGNVAPGEHHYTIELEGYKPISGTVQVSSETANEGMVTVIYSINNNSSIEENINEDKNTNFIVYFSSQDKSIHIKPVNDVTEVWNMKLVSGTGVTTYQSKIYPETGEILIPTANLSGGFYLLVMENGKEICTNKLIIK